MEITLLYSIIGFLLAAYSVVANDSVQTLGTFIASNSQRFKWYYLWIAASSVLLFTLWYGWSMNVGAFLGEKNLKTSSLGVGGHGPLFSLAVLRE